MQVVLVIVFAVLALVTLLATLASLTFVRLYRPAVWSKCKVRLLGWLGEEPEELQALTPTTSTCPTPVQIVSTSVNDECRVIDVVDGSMTPCSDAGSVADSTARIVAASRKLRATATFGGLLADSDSKSHLTLTAQRSFGPYLSLEDADPDSALARSVSFNARRRVSSPNTKEFLKVSNEISDYSLSRAPSAESFVSDTATPDLERDFRAHRVTLEFNIQYSEECMSLNLLKIGLNGLFDAENTYSIKFALGPGSRLETTEFARPNANGMVTFTKELKFAKVQSAHLDSYEVAAKLLKKSASKVETESGFTQFQLDFLYVLHSAFLKFELEEVDCAQQCPGEIIISLSYLPTAKRVTTVLIKAKDLKTTSDVLVKSYLLENGKITSRKRTTAKKRTDLVTWAEVIIFRPEANNIEKCQLRFVVATVNEKDKAHSSILGSVSIGPETLGSGLIHWHQIMSSPRKAIVMTHRLTPNC